MYTFATGNSTVRDRLSLYIDELYKVQEALKEEGYLSAFPSEHFDRAEALKGVWWVGQGHSLEYNFRPQSLSC